MNSERKPHLAPASHFASAQTTLPTLVTCFVLLCVQLLPEVPVYLGVASSFSVGTTIAAAATSIFILIFLYIHKSRHSTTLLDSGAFGIILIIIILTAICSQAVLANSILPINKIRLIESIVPLAFLLSAGLAIAAVFRLSSPYQLDISARTSFWVLIGVSALSIFHLEPPGTFLAHPTFPFTETSHLALVLGPIFIYRCAVCHRSYSIFWILFGLALGVLLKSATLVVFVFGGALIARRLAFACMITLIPLAAGAATHLSYFTSRADISSHSSSISALVYLQGWEFLVKSIQETNGIGVGFQQLGIHSLHLPVTELIRIANGGGALNQYDGSFLFSKIGSEFGIFGLLLVALYCWQGVKVIHQLRRRSTPSTLILSQCIFIGFAVDLFIRGMGYFSGATLLFIGALFSFNFSPFRNSIVDSPISSSLQ